GIKFVIDSLISSGKGIKYVVSQLIGKFATCGRQCSKKYGREIRGLCRVLFHSSKTSRPARRNCCGCFLLTAPLPSSASPAHRGRAKVPFQILSSKNISK